MKPFEEDQAKIKSLEERIEQLESGSLSIYAIHMTLLETVADYKDRYLINCDKLEKLYTE